jgi:hypothetical protein
VISGQWPVGRRWSSVVGHRSLVFGHRSSVVGPRVGLKSDSLRLADSRGGGRYVGCGGEPGYETEFKISWSFAYRTAVAGCGDFPQGNVGIAGLDTMRVADRNVAVDLAVNQGNWNRGCCYRIFWGDLLHAESVLPSDVEESEFDYGAEQSESEPGAEVKRLAMRS